MKKLVLVLSGGAAKGFAHIGVLKILQRYGIVPDAIIGTSMGALVGGAYAAGVSLNEIENMAKEFTGIGNFSLFSTLFKGNVLNVSKVAKLLDKIFKNITHEECPIPFTAVATDLKKGKECHLNSGLLKDNVMASISMPGIFPLKKIGETYYCDGGLMNNLAEDYAKQTYKDAFVLGVDVIGDYEKQYEQSRIKSYENMVNAINLMTINIVKSHKIKADQTITITMPKIKQLSFSKESAEKAIRCGAKATKNAIEEIERKLNED